MRDVASLLTPHSPWCERQFRPPKANGVAGRWVRRRHRGHTVHVRGTRVSSPRTRVGVLMVRFVPPTPTRLTPPFFEPNLIERHFQAGRALDRYFRVVGEDREDVQHLLHEHPPLSGAGRASLRWSWREPAERSVERAVKRSRETCPARSSPLSPGERRPRWDALNGRGFTVRLHKPFARIARVPSVQARRVLLVRVTHRKDEVVGMLLG